MPMAEEKYGAGDRIRTGDIDLGKVALYQLSYSRSTELHFHPETILMSNVMATSHNRRQL